jgi:Acetoacetate decarboxylase (ADC)
MITTPFIYRVDDPQIPPPYSFPDVQIHSFELEADPRRLQALCDKFLNIGTLAERGFEYRPLLPYVALEVLFYPQMTSTIPPFSNYGFLSQNEAYFRFPVVKYEPIGFLLLPVEVSNFFPYLFVDSSWSAFSGREVIGFPKVIGTITQQTAADGSYQGAVNVPVYPRFSPSTQQTSQPIIDIQTGAPGPGPAVTWPWLITTLEQVQSLLLGITEFIFPDFFSTIQLKQIRDGEDPFQACFQGLVHSQFTVENVSLPQLYDEASIDLYSFASLDVVTDLGFSAANPITPVLSYYTNCDMTFGDTTNMFITTG